MAIATMAAARLRCGRRALQPMPAWVGKGMAPTGLYAPENGNSGDVPPGARAMIYGSVCSGIEAASVAWRPLGWRPAFFAEIAAFPRAVLAHHYPAVPLHGDFTTIRAGRYEPIDVLVGGTPCQSFSIAGLRGGLGDARGNLALEYLHLAQRLCPRWIVWENVSGVLSAISHDAADPCEPPHDMVEGCEWVGEDQYDADENHAFAGFLAGLSELGYGWAYRSLDAQYFGLAQRRERVFVVGYLGDWRRAASVLFEPQSLQWDSPPRREAQQAIAPTISARPTGGGGLGTDFDCDGGLVTMPLAFGGNNTSGPIDVATACNAHGGPHGRLDFESETFVTHALRADGFDASEDGTGRGTPIVPVAFHGSQDPCVSGDVTHPIGRNQGQETCAMIGSAVRRLTPRECERLQGFPDDYTLIPWRRGMAADGPRYKALGNSMAVPVMRWIGERMAAVDAEAGAA